MNKMKLTQVGYFDSKEGKCISRSSFANIANIGKNVEPTLVHNAL